MKVIPAILAERENDFFYLIRQAEAFTDYVQIDIMDGFFVPSRSFPVPALNRLTTTLDFEIHLMVKHPSAFMIQVHHPNARKVIYHVESSVEHLDFIGQMKHRGIGTGLAVKPETPVKEFQGLIQNVDSLLFMTVDPGYYGSPFKADVLNTITMTRSLFPDLIIGADGGVSLDNLHLFIDAGVDYVCVGSRIFQHGDPPENYKGFLRRIADIKKEEGNKK